MHSVLLDAKPALGLTTAEDTFTSLITIAGKVEYGWIHGGLAGVPESDIGKLLNIFLWTC